MRTRPSRSAIAVLVLTTILSVGALLGRRPAIRVVVTHEVTQGFEEPHTPGSSDPRALPASGAVRTLLGPRPDLNRVGYLRFAAAPGRGPERAAPISAAAGAHRAESRHPGRRPRAILILVPGFIVDASEFSPMARDLVQESGGALEVWAVERRPNQLEDRLGTRHARAGLEAGDAHALIEGAQFYFAESPVIDIDADGEIDPPVELEDAFGVTRPFVAPRQDDVRFMAHWGVDTYVRDWKILVERARARVGPKGLVLFGGHSQGTAWAGLFAAYDFDADPAVTVAGHALIDGLLLLEGGGPGTGSATVPLSTGPLPRPTTWAAYRAVVEQLASEGGPDVFLPTLLDIDLARFGASAELAGLAGRFRPGAPSIVQRTPIISQSSLALFFSAPATNRALIALFVDDDFQPATFLRASVGFSDNAPNGLSSPLPNFGFFDDFYVALPAIDDPADPDDGNGLRVWKNIDDELPRCPPGRPDDGLGCALIDHGPIDRERFCLGGATPGAPCASSGDCPGGGLCPGKWGAEREVTDVEELMGLTFEQANLVEWYFASGRPTGLDFSYGRDSRVLVDASLEEAGHEGPLVVTQNASMDKPVLCIGASNGLTPRPESFAAYLGSIATPAADQEVRILEGYAHADVTTAAESAAVPLIADWVERLLERKRRSSRASGAAAPPKPERP